MNSLLIATGVVFMAELGDKTQLVAVSLATRYRIGMVLLGIGMAFLATQGVGALAGGLIGTALPQDVIGVGTALAFMGFAVWNWFDVEEEDTAELVASTAGGWRALAGVIIAMTLAELGDKSVLATTSLAADRDPLLTWFGGAVGGTVAAALGVLVGGLMGSRLSPRVTKRVAAVLFAVFGVLLLFNSLR